MPHSLTCGKLAIWTLIAVLIQITGLSLFIFGFFPVKPTLPGFSGPESYQIPSCNPVSDAGKVELTPDQLRSLYKELSNIPPVYDRLILMVIDGLPAEFILGKGGKSPNKAMREAMPYTQSLLFNCNAVGFHAKAAPPTVTMPRLKAMISGAIGGFLDVAFNFNTQAFLDDNLLDQFYRIGWKLVMLGDETWIKLFPNLFSRQDGVSSFFVKDTVEVDFNVTRHMDDELAAKDWNLLILHYLGLDHVGHVGGRKSTLMAPKLKEMDEIIKRIHMQSILQPDNFDNQTLLVVVSDHGMTESGNHGGSSYEEMDSLALFIGHSVHNSNCLKTQNYEASQVDIAPTLALLFGVPIPKNNIGVLLTQVFHSLTDEQRLRSLELNSWQLFRLLQANLPGFCCKDSNSDFEFEIKISTSDHTEKKLCHLFSKSLSAHNSWRLQKDSYFISEGGEYYTVAAESYYYFLRNASDWLSHRATDKPIKILLSAVALMLISCLLLFGLFYSSFHKVICTVLNKSNYTRGVDEIFTVLIVLLHALSLGSSSFVEEEQYTWHFLTSTLYLTFLFSTVQVLIKSPISKQGIYIYKLSPLIVILICGRIIRGWHQGGINWVHLPDISKLLLHSSPSTIKILQIISALAVFSLYSYSLFKQRLRKKIVIGVWLSYVLSICLVILHIYESQISNLMLINPSSTSIVQLIYIISGISVILTLSAFPWIWPVDRKGEILLVVGDCAYAIGATYSAFWCLLQLILQNPVNVVPVLLIYIQILCSVIHFSASGPPHKPWVDVAAIQFIGLAGHFGLGNTNSLATIDVAGAFIGISSYSTVLSGILMFIITYASPILSFLSMVMYISIKDFITTTSSGDNSKISLSLEELIAFPCLIPLVVNSVGFTSFTVVLLLMRNHLFIWSVFSPKYLYVCAATVSVYIGVIIISFTGFYLWSVFSFRIRNFQLKGLTDFVLA